MCTYAEGNYIETKAHLVIWMFITQIEASINPHGHAPRTLLHASRGDSSQVKAQVKSSCHSPNSTEQTAHCDHKPRVAWVFVRLLLHRRSAAGWAEAHSSRRPKEAICRGIGCRWARLAHSGWSLCVVPTAPRSLERIRREMRQAKPPARGGAARASLGL